MLAARLPFWTQLGSFWGGSGSIFDRFWYHGWRVKNIDKTSGFLWLFALLRCSEGVAEASWGLSLAMLAQSCLQDRICLASWGHLGTMLGHVGAKMAIKSAKMSQHRRNRVPRWAQLCAMTATKGALKSRKKPTTTTKVEQSPAAPLHALRAEGTVADI